MLSPAYVAGFFDADGCVSACNREWGRCGIQVSFTNTRKRVLLLLRDVVGGTITTQGHRAKDTHAPHMQLTMYADTAKKALQMMLLFLVLKRGQAELALMFLAERAALGGRLSETQKRIRTWCGSRISMMNHNVAILESA
jgi:hypothetical protein